MYLFLQCLEKIFLSLMAIVEKNWYPGIFGNAVFEIFTDFYQIPNKL